MPVLGHIDGETRRRQVLPEADLLQPVGELLVVVLSDPGEGLPGQGGSETPVAGPVVLGGRVVLTVADRLVSLTG